MEIFPDTLTAQEKEVLYNMPLYVTVLIAGADGNVDSAEIRKAVQLSELKTTIARAELKEYYTWASVDFEDRLAELLLSMPKDQETRTNLLVNELTRLNDVLPKLDDRFQVEFVSSARDFAKKIAKASGGVLGYMSIGYEESKLISLDMINDPD
jgi:hypothetical protein